MKITDYLKNKKTDDITTSILSDNNFDPQKFIVYASIYAKYPNIATELMKNPLILLSLENNCIKQFKFEYYYFKELLNNLKSLNIKYKLYNKLSVNGYDKNNAILIKDYNALIIYSALSKRLNLKINDINKLEKWLTNNYYSDDETISKGLLRNLAINSFYRKTSEHRQLNNNQIIFNVNFSIDVKSRFNSKFIFNFKLNNNSFIYNDQSFHDKRVSLNSGIDKVCFNFEIDTDINNTIDKINNELDTHFDKFLQQLILQELKTNI